MPLVRRGPDGPATELLTCAVEIALCESIGIRSAARGRLGHRELWRVADPAADFCGPYLVALDRHCQSL